MSTTVVLTAELCLTRHDRGLLTHMR
jgi:hypothetical protein